MKILAVDDEPFILELLPKFARKLGFADVGTASSGEEALAAISQADPAYDCFLVDINMPQMDGIELVSRIRDLPAHRKTPIIMLTAMVERNYVERAFRVGATDYATKPFDLVELGARLRSAHDLGKAYDAARNAAEDDARTRESDHGRIFEIGGRGQILDSNAIRNYLTQLSRAGLDGSQILAVKIDRSEAIHARASAAEFAYALTEVGDAIDDILRPGGYVMSYVGNGYFIAVSRQATLTTSEQLESNVQALLDDRMTEYDDGTPLDLDVSIGNPIRPGTGELSDIDQVFQRAMSRARQRCAQKQKKPRPFSFVGRKF